jgi:hypothetical protein
MNKINNYSKLKDLPEFEIKLDIIQFGSLFLGITKALNDLQFILKLHDLSETDVKNLGKRVNDCERALQRMKTESGVTSNPNLSMIERNLINIKRFLDENLQVTIVNYTGNPIDAHFADVDIIDTTDLNDSVYSIENKMICDTVEPTVYYKNKLLGRAKVIVFKKG